MAFYCEECLEQVTPEELRESELKYGGHVFCRRCQEKIRNIKKVDKKTKSEDWI